MIEAFLNYSFLQNALLAGLLIGLLAPLIGTFVVVQQLSFIADTLSHVSLAGIALGLLLQSYTLTIFPPFYFGALFAIIGGVLLEHLRGYFEHYKEAVMPIILSLGVALSVIFISAGNGFNSEILGYMFGSITTVSKLDVVMLGILTIFIIVFIRYFYHTLLALSFNSESASLLGIKVRTFQFLFIIILSTVISLSIKIVGTLLISALMITPVTASMRVAKSFKQTLVYSIVFSELSILVGLAASYYLNVPSGAMIVLFNVLILFVVIFIEWLSKGGFKK